MKTTDNYVSVQLLNLLLSSAATSSDDMNSILKLTRIEPNILKNKGARIGIEKFAAVISVAVSRTGNGYSGLYLAQKIPHSYSNNHILLTIMSNCATLEKALEKLIQYHDIASNSIKLRLEKQSLLSALVFRAATTLQPDFDRIFMEAALASCAIMFRDFTTGKARFREIHFMHSGPDDPGDYLRLFDCPIIFGSNENKIVFANDDLALPIILSDPELLSTLELYAQKILSPKSAGPVWAAQISDFLNKMMIQGQQCDINHVAQKMAVSIRTLQKQLRRENTTYRELLEQVKKNIAVKNLQNMETSLVDIAFLLGFSEQSAFNHAFKKWTGLSPRKYREAKMQSYQSEIL